MIWNSARQQDNNSLFLAVLIWIKKSTDFNQWCVFLSIVKKQLFCMLWIRVTTKTANHLKPFEITHNQQKPSETTWNYSLHRNATPLHRAMSHQILPCFSPCWLWTIRKVELRKNVKNSAMIMNHKGKLWTHERTLKQVYKICLNEIV